MGLSRDDIRKWFEVCYPVQVRCILRDFAQYSVHEQMEMGMRGLRGLKSGILKRRQEEQRQLALTRINDAKQAMRVKTISAKQDFEAIAEEFL